METYKQQVIAVETLGEVIGYGHLMHLASALWRQKLKESGTPENGAFIPTMEFCIKKSELKNVKKDKELYDKIIFNSKNPNENDVP
jgi:hypothetical protein